MRRAKTAWSESSKLPFEQDYDKQDIIDEAMEKKLIGMVGFRNVIVHGYQAIDYKRVEDVVKKHVDSLIEFASMLVAASPK